MSDTTELARTETPGLVILKPLARPEQLIAAQEETVQFLKRVLKEGVDYGVIPGSGDKKNLLKAGAEKTCAGFGLQAEYEILSEEFDHDRENHFTLTKWITREKPRDKTIEADLKASGKGRSRKFGDKWIWQESENEDGTSFGLYRYVIKCRLLLGDREVGQGVGSCSSMETKYIRNPRDAENTILKMGKKRAYVDAVLTTLSLSDRFTQDLEDITANRAATGDAEPPVDAEFSEAPPETREETYERQKAENEALAKLAGGFLQFIGFNTDTFTEFKTYCQTEKVSWVDTALQAKAKGVKTATELWLLVKEGRGPAEQVEPIPTDDLRSMTEKEIDTYIKKLEFVATDLKDLKRDLKNASIDWPSFVTECWKAGIASAEAMIHAANVKTTKPANEPEEWDPFSDDELK